MTNSSYRNWAMASIGLLALTYGLERLFDGKPSRTAIGATAAAIPLAVGGLAGWTRSLIDAARS